MVNNDTQKNISFENILEIIKEGGSGYTKYSGEEETIFFEDYVITTSEKYHVFDEDVIVNLRLEFKGCTFSEEKAVFIMGMACREYVTFDNCNFSDGLFLHSGSFAKDLAFKQIKTDHFQLLGGTFSTITFSAREINMLWISGGKFEMLDIGYWVGGPTLGDLTIINNKGELGNIRVRTEFLNRLSIHGTNLDNTYEFKGIKCNDVSIADFTNTGGLNFIGLSPADPAQPSYFQIVNSNLNKAQFYRTMFGQYSEFIIVDSYLIDCLFIGCQWASNVRALLGPGYGTFKESLKNGRKLEPIEKHKIKEAYRQLKLSMNKHSDKIQETLFYAKEMNVHNDLLNWSPPWKNSFWDKVIIHFSRIFSDYGQSFIRPLFWLLVVHLFLFNLAIALQGFEPLHISLFHPTAAGFKTGFEKYFIYINPLRRLETSLSGYLIILDFVMRIWSSYMLYNIVRATRRFIS